MTIKTIRIFILRCLKNSLEKFDVFVFEFSVLTQLACAQFPIPRAKYLGAPILPMKPGKDEKRPRSKQLCSETLWNGFWAESER